MSQKTVSVFMGTPLFAVPILEALAEVTELRLVITQPDRPVGRGRKMDAPPVKKVANALGIEVIQPDVVKGKRFAAQIAEFKPDVLVTAAFGRILGKSLLGLPRLGCLNVHASLLPYYRGAAPINWAILNGETRTGVSVMRMDEGLDTGDVYHSLSIEIGEQETTGELTPRISVLGARALVEVLTEIENKVAVPQDHDLATHASVLKKSDGEVDWKKGVSELHCHLRGMHPWPCAFTMLNGQPMKLHRGRIISSGDIRERPGTVLEHTEFGVDVACGNGMLRLTDVQLPGKKQLSSHQFFAGNKLERGTILG